MMGRLKKELEIEVTGRIEENDLLRKENEQLKKELENLSFTDNPELFTVNTKSDRYFGNITVADAIALLKNCELPNRRINIGWEII